MTWDSLLSYCVAVIGLTPTIYWQSTFAQVVGFIRECNHVQREREQQAWERTRWQTAALLNVHAKKGKQLKPTDLVKFPWEEKKRKKSKHGKLTWEERHHRFGRMDRDTKRLWEEQQKQIANGTK